MVDASPGWARALLSPKGGVCVRWWNGKATGVGDLGDESGASSLPTVDLSSQLFRPTGWSLGFGPRSLFLRLDPGLSLS